MSKEGIVRAKFGELLKSRDERLPNDGTHPLYSLTIKDGVTPKTERYEREFLVTNKESKKYKVIRTGDLVFNPSNLRWGAIATSFIQFPVLASPIYEVFYPKDDQVLDPYFLGALASSPILMARYLARVEGTLIERTALKKDDFLEIEIEIPPLPEQKKIAEILSGIDRQITLGKHSLEKLALLESATIKSAIDRIENIHSDCRQLTAGEICRKIFVGIASSTTHAYTDKTGVPMLRNQNIKLGTIDSADLVYINKDFAEEQKNKRLLQGDVITARTGYPGASAVVSREFEDCHSFTTLISRVETGLVIPEYYSLYLNSPQGKVQVAQLQAGGAQANLNVSALEKMIIPIPGLETQNRIVKASEELQRAFRAKESIVRKYERLKDALSSDLLSGRKRVSV
jgi:type I restriction enzyme S subunit